MIKLINKYLNLLIAIGCFILPYFVVVGVGDYLSNNSVPFYKVYILLIYVMFFIIFVVGSGFHFLAGYIND